MGQDDQMSDLDAEIRIHSQARLGEPCDRGALREFHGQAYRSAFSHVLLGVPAMPATTISATNKAMQCLAQAVPIPGAPLWSMGRAAMGSQSEFDAMQGAIDYLTCKAKVQSAFSATEREFLVEVFEAFRWGGEFRQLPEAAALANHYVHGQGKTLRIDAAVYEKSAIVRDTVIGIKALVRDRLAAKREVAQLRSTDAAFVHSVHGRALFKHGGRNVDTQGYLIDGGVLLAEQSNSRLKTADNRFVLAASTSVLPEGRMLTRWRVDSKYDFEPFSKASYYTNIPLSAGRALKLPDGLSHYMTVLGIAAEFNYWAEWNDHWNA